MVHGPTMAETMVAQAMVTLQNNPQLTSKGPPICMSKSSNRSEVQLGSQDEVHQVALMLTALDDNPQSAPAAVGCMMIPTLDRKGRPTNRLKIHLNVAGTTIGWDGVPRRPAGKGRPSSTSRLPRVPLASDGIPIIDNRRVASGRRSLPGTPRSRKRKLRSQSPSEDAMDEDKENVGFANVKVKWLFADPKKKFFREVVQKEATTRMLGDAKTTGVKFRLKFGQEFMANSQFGAWGLAPVSIQVMENVDKPKYSCPASCMHTLFVSSPEDIHNWWEGTPFPNRKRTKKLIRDLVLWHLPIAKLFAAGWPAQSFRTKLLTAYKNPRLDFSLKHNKEYCPTMFNMEDKAMYAFHQRRSKWIEFHNLSYLPIQIKGMLAGEGGLLLVYGNKNPRKPAPQSGNKTIQTPLHIPPWLNPRRHDQQIYPPQHILVVCNPITRAYRFLPPLMMFLRLLAARMTVTRHSESYSIHLMGWNFVKEDDNGKPISGHELHVAVYDSTTQHWIPHLKIFDLARPILNPLRYDKILPLIKGGPDGRMTIYTTGEVAADAKKKHPSSFKPVIISYNLDTLTWATHMFTTGKSDPPTILECNNSLFGVSRCFEGVHAFVQIRKLVSCVGPDGKTMAPKFVKYGPPMPNRYYRMNYPRFAFPHDLPLHLNCVAGTGNIWIAAPDQCCVLFFNVKAMQWSNITAMKFESGRNYLGNWAFQPAIHAQVE